jgi:F0F1-type ATP synthase beta subunit
MNKGTITEVIGPVVEVHFEKDRPAIQDALVIEANDVHGRITLEVARTSVSTACAPSR